MMARLAFSLLALFLAACTLQVNAAPHDRRQVPDLGNLECNTARVEFIVSAIAAGYSAENIKTTDPATVSALVEVEAGFKNITLGIENYALALVNKQVIAENIHEEIVTGVATAMTALSKINQADPAVTLLVGYAQGNLTNAMNVGEALDDSCPE